MYPPQICGPRHINETDTTSWFMAIKNRINTNFTANYPKIKKIK